MITGKRTEKEGQRIKTATNQTEKTGHVLKHSFIKDG